jgi:CBS domain-containing protein
MGELAIHRPRDEEEARAFTRAVVRDIRALDALIEAGGIETGVTRMGVEQEMYLVGHDGKPAPCAMQVLERIGDKRFTTELALFNLEANLDPHLLRGSFLHEMERELREVVDKVDAVAAGLDANVLLTGILPTLRPEHLTLENLTPLKRYEYLNEALFRDGEAITILIDGTDQYQGVHDSVMLEAANTSLQLHLQVTPESSAASYNLMQLITAPLLAAAANSPILLGHRLWHETRVAVFERSLDSRNEAQMSREFPTRVSFGQDWVHGNIVDLFRDNVARFPAILSRELTEDSLETVARGEAPRLAALALHNGTVWRWNRPCYGVADGVAHLRLENRVLPAGPTVPDEVANAALFYGMMTALPARCGDVASRLSFREAKANFLAAARQGLDAQFGWLDGTRVDARRLLLEQLLPAAREGLASLDVPTAQSDRYLGIIEARVTSGMTGASWLLKSFDAYPQREPQSVLRGAITTMLRGQRENSPVHEWALAVPDGDADESAQTVAAVMTSDLFTVRPDDVIDLASGVMEWKRIRHIPVEDADGHLVGVLTARDLLAGSQGAGAPASAAASSGGREPVVDTPVSARMTTTYTTVSPDLDLVAALPLMLDSALGILLVVEGRKLVGVVTERDMLRGLASRIDADG